MTSVWWTIIVLSFADSYLTSNADLWHPQKKVGEFITADVAIILLRLQRDYFCRALTKRSHAVFTSRRVRISDLN